MNDFTAIASSPRRIRQSNAIAALEVLYRAGAMSRAELARKMGLNRSSSGNIVAELTAGGLVREVAEDKARRAVPLRAGRPGILLELEPDAAFFLGAEIGVEHVATTVIDLAADVRKSTVEPFDGRSVAVGEAVARAVDQVFRDLPEEMRSRCEGLGFSAPAQMDREGRVLTAPLLGWRDVDLAAIARTVLPVDMPVMVENDANAFAIGEVHSRPGSRRGVTLFLVVESGVGGGIVIDGRLFRGGHGLAGEIGHMLVGEGEDRELEQIIGLERLMRDWRGVARGPHSTLDDFLGEVRDREPEAVAIADAWARHLAHALVQACRLIDPNRIVLGGSVAALFPLVAARVAAYVRDFQAPTFPIPEIVRHEGATSGSAFGAACMMHQRFMSLDDQRFTDESRGVDAGAAS